MPAARMPWNENDGEIPHMTRIVPHPSLPWDLPYSDREISRPGMRERHATGIFRNFFYLLQLLLSISALWPVIASADPGRDRPSASQYLQEFIEKMDTLTANFQQTLSDEQGQLLESSRGIAHMARPGRFHWTYHEPYRQTIVADGNRIWFYDEELAQIIVRSWDSFSPDTPAALLTMKGPLEKIFTVEDLGAMGAPKAGAETRTRQWVRLTPKSPDATFIAIKLGFGKKAIEVMELFDSFGQTTKLTFSGVTVNPSLDPGLFSFTPPAGVDVVESNPGKTRHR
uniref:Outer-membrane lipoprotein carrier protein n=1 Tax=Candidatus Kentrum sp. FW TaxID=2126338 RepID=A0A450STH4_9GAMM|nr:MAG: outer membrane lipoprotein carrier protein [Candidatus Kentron sp. FW]